MSKERLRIPKKALLFGNAVLALSAIAAACSGGSEATSPTVVPTTPNTPTPERTASPIVSPTSTPDIKPTPTATIRPTPTPEQTPTPKPEVILSPQELIELVNEAVSNLTPTQQVGRIQNAVQTAPAHIEAAKQDPKGIRSPIGVYGDGVRAGLTPLACQNPDNSQLGEAWLAIRNWVQNYSLEHEAKGNLPPGSTLFYLNFYFFVPIDCTHPLLATN